MRVLILSPYLPFPPHFGGASRIYNLIKQLSNEHSITLLTLVDEEGREEHVKEMFNFCESVIPVQSHNTLQSIGMRRKRIRQLMTTFSLTCYQYKSFFYPEMQQQIYRTLSQKPFDIVQVEFAQMGYYDMPTDAGLILDEHNIEHDILKRTFKSETDPVRKLFNLFEYIKFRRDEIKLCRKFDACVTTSDRDARVLGRLLPQMPITVVPNGVDTSYFKPTKREKEEDFTLVFTGTIRYYPNTEGLTFFLQKVFPLIREKAPAARLFIVGSDPPEEIKKFSSDNVIVTGFVPDVRPYLERATAVIVPLRIGGGTRLKVLEALSMEKPMVATAVGCEGIEITNNENILVADEPEAFARAVLDLFERSALRRRLATAGRTLVEQRYDWARSAERLSSVYLDIKSSERKTTTSITQRTRTAL